MYPRLPLNAFGCIVSFHLVSFIAPYCWRYTTTSNLWRSRGRSQSPAVRGSSLNAHVLCYSRRQRFLHTCYWSERTLIYQKFRTNTITWPAAGRPSAIVHLSTRDKRIILCRKYNIQLQCKKKATKSATPEHNHHHLFEVFKEQVVTSKLEIAHMSDNQHAHHDALLGAGYVLHV